MRDVDDIFGDDYMVPGQTSIFDLIDEGQNPLIAVSKVFAQALKRMSLKEWKTFISALTRIKWKEQNSRLVHIPKWDLVDLLGITCDPTDVTHNLKRDIGDLPRHSFIEIADKDKDFWENGVVVTRVRCYKEYVLVALNQDYMPLFQELDKEKRYITLWAEDLFRMTSERSILFYESLRLHSDTRRHNTRVYGVRDFKQLFGIPKDGRGSYMRPDGHFDRPAFEKKVIDPLCDDLKNCAMIHLAIGEDGAPYRKVKYHGKVRGYEFSWTVSDRPHIASAAAVDDVVAELRADPKLLKIAKDLVDGKKNPKPSNSRFNGLVSERSYDYDALEREAEEKLMKRLEDSEDDENL